MLNARDATFPIDTVLPTTSEPLFIADMQAEMTDIHAAASARTETMQNDIYSRHNRPYVHLNVQEFVLAFNPAGK